MFKISPYLYWKEENKHVVMADVSFFFLVEPELSGEVSLTFS